MALDAFRARLGIDQGRVELGPTGAGGAHAFGNHVFVLGAETAGRMHDLGVGDYAELLQRADLTGADLVRVSATCSVRAVPLAVAWELSLRIDGSVRARRRLRPNQTTIVSDLAANVAGMSGEHDITVRLELVAAS